MENDTDKLIKEQLDTLPESLQRAIASVPWKTLVQQIGKENSLSTEQLESLERETMFIIYAFEPIEDYTANLMREIQIDESLATTIAEMINEKIFEVIALKVEGAEKEKSSNEPIIITNETKVDAMKELNRRSEEIQKMQAPLVEIRKDIHPMIEKGEVAHEVPHVEQSFVPPTPEPKSEVKPVTQVPDYRYPKGKDPYREPTD